jgi:hypothetical protein
MNLNWITSPLTIYAALCLGGMAFLYLAVTTRLESGMADARHKAECDALRKQVTELSAKLDELAAETKECVPVPAGIPMAGLNIQKRSEALRMYRRGSDPHTVGAALGLSHAEVVLLQKVHRVLAGQTQAVAID